MTEILRSDCSQCPMCGCDGLTLYVSQVDRLFGAPGAWNFRRCDSGKCGIIWLDPMPLPQELWKAYQTYYTHDEPVSVSPGSLVMRFWSRVKQAYLAERYGYNCSMQPAYRRAVASLLYALPVRRSRIDGEIRFLNAQAKGRLLDVGCGSGSFMERMRGLGWTVEGTDFDIKAVERARAKGLNVSCGTLKELKFAENSYDAITLNHVIEHVPMPLETIEECRRILKPGGKMVIVTPNGESLAHLIYKSDWRGLEPPRHLQVFTPHAIRAAIKGVGFSTCVVGTHNAYDVWLESHRLARLSSSTGTTESGKRKGSRISLVLTLLEQCLLVLRPYSGECIHAIGGK